MFAPQAAVQSDMATAYTVYLQHNFNCIQQLSHVIILRNITVANACVPNFPDEVLISKCFFQYRSRRIRKSISLALLSVFHRGSFFRNLRNTY